ATFIAAEQQRGFALTHAPLARVHLHLRSQESFQFTFSEHHAILDGWSVATMLTELFEHYFVLLGQLQRALPVAPSSRFRDFVALERRTLAPQSCQQYWATPLAGSNPTRLPRWPGSTAPRAPLIQTLPVPLSPDLSDGLKQLAHATGVPLKTVLLA